MTFRSNRKFKVWAYTVSHCSLLLRSEMKYKDSEDYSKETSYNIDIEFGSVVYINIPTYLQNIEITEISIDLLPEEISRKFMKYGEKAFEIQCNGNKYYIIAANILVGTNNWESQDRIFNSNLKHNEILFSL